MTVEELVAILNGDEGEGGCAAEYLNFDDEMFLDDMTAIPQTWQGTNTPVEPSPIDLNQVMRERCKDAGTIGFLTGVLEALRWQVSGDLREKIDAALEKAKS